MTVSSLFRNFIFRFYNKKYIRRHKMLSNTKAAIFNYCRSNKLDKPHYLTDPPILSPGTEFIIKLKVGSRIISLPSMFTSKRIAEQKVAEEACRVLNIETTPSLPQPQKKFEIAPLGDVEDLLPNKKPKVETPACFYNASSFKEMVSYLTHEQLAGHFKSILHYFAQTEGDPNLYPRYETKPVLMQQGNFFYCILDYKGSKFQSNGLMSSIKQAELSAAEVCLRSLHHLPPVSNSEDYSIQPYSGGYFGKFPKIFLSKYVKCLSNVLCELNIDKPIVKYIQTNSGYTGEVDVEGKIFVSYSTNENIEVSKLAAVKEVFSYLGIQEITSTVPLTKGINLKKSSKRTLLVAKDTPFLYCPSRQKGWIHRCCKDEDISDSAFGKTCDEEVFKVIQHSESGASKTFYKTLISREPSLNNHPLQSMTNLCVAEAIKKDLFIVGNSMVSMMMFCENGQLFSKNRNKNIQLLPGHRISNILSTYELSLPSFQIYLHAKSCNDVSFPNPPLPVPTSCGAVIIMHDHETNGGPHILLCRQLTDKPFIQVAERLKIYFNDLIYDNPAKLDIKKITEHLSSWDIKEVNSMSLMTLESISELFSSISSYDERYNEIFIKELPHDLKSLQHLCQQELKHRLSKRQVTSEGDNFNWDLPKSSFKHKFLSVGPYMESSIMCVSRLIKEKTGLLIKLSDLEECVYIDEPNTNNKGSHRGDVVRYYMWNKTKPFNNSDIYSYIQQKEEFADNSKNEKNSAEEGTNMDSSQDEEKEEEDCFDKSKEYYMELKWFPIQEASTICLEVRKLYQKKAFKDKLNQVIS